MSKCQGKRVWVIAQVFAIASIGEFPYALPVLSQIVPDNTLPINSQVVPGCTVCTINGGTVRGNNLFHSFQQFSIPTGGEAHFNNAANIQNILTRVTGNSISNIDGLIRANGGVNLFLLNPNGINFGANARLQIGGSFLATTANSFKFSDGSEFSAVNPQAPPLLAINVPLGLQYGTANTATIRNRGNLSAGRDLTLAAANLDLQGQVQAGENLTLQAQDTVKIRDGASQPLIASAGKNLFVQGDTIDIFALNHPDSRLISGSDLILQSAHTVVGDAHYWAGGNFRIETPNGTPGNLSSPHDPIILASGDVMLGDYSGASLHILAGGSVTLDNIEITGADATDAIYPENSTLFNSSQTIGSLASFALSDGTPITIAGNAIPTLDVRAGVNWAALGGFPAPDPTLHGEVPATTAPATSANITVNGIILNFQPDGIVLLTNQFQPTAVPGTIVTQSIFTSLTDSGPVFIDSRDDFALNPFSTIDTSTSVGNGGDIRLLAQGNVLLDHGRFNSKTSGGSRGGDITVRAQSLILTNRSTLDAAAQGNSTAGDITIRADSFSLTNDATINSSTSGSGNAGNVTINAGSFSLTNNASINGSTSGSGNAGNVAINANNLDMTTGANISTATAGSGRGGNITLGSASRVIDQINIDGKATGLFANVGEGATGDGGNIAVYARSLSLSNSAEISGEVKAGGSGNGGEVMVQTRSLSLTNEATINTSTSGSGKAGSIRLGNADSPIQQIILSGKATGLSANTSDRSVATLSNPVMETGDAGQLLSTAQMVTASTQISGNLLDYTDVDLYRIDLSGGQTFSATTDGSAADTRLYLFDSNGLGVYANDDISIANYQSTLPANHAFTPVTAGTYYLAVTSFLNDALSAEGNIFDFSSFTDISRPTGAGGASSLTGWSGGNSFGDYRVQLTGLSGTAKPQTIPGGSGGNIAVYAGTLTITNQAEISAITTGSGNAGSITVDAHRFEATSGGKLLTSTSGSGRAGNITLGSLGREVNWVSADGVDTGLFANTRFGASGNGGNLAIFAGSLAITNSAQMVTRTGGKGNAGNITVSARDIAMHQQSRLSSSVEPTGIGNSGSVTIHTGSLTVTDGAAVAASTRGQGNASSVTIIAQDRVTLARQGRISSAVRFGAQGNGGDVNITTGTFTATEGGLLEARSGGIGNAGSITLNARDRVFLQADSHILNTIDATGVGRGGSIAIASPQVILQNGSGIAVNSNTVNNSANGIGAAGNIFLQSNRLTLDNNASITAETTGGAGGNISLNIHDLLLMRHNSVISTSAGSPQQRGNGGNLAINAPRGFIVGVLNENSDIIANAFGGKGGTIQISAIQVLGFKPRSRLSPVELQTIRSNGISDISASSDVGADGLVSIQTLGLDPSSGLIELPTDLVDSANLISQECSLDGNAAKRHSSFVSTGRGGMPRRSDDLQTSGAIAIPWVSSSSVVPTNPSATPINSPRNSAEPIVEAQAIAIAPNGDIYLTAEATTAIVPHAAIFPAMTCPQSR